MHETSEIPGFVVAVVATVRRLVAMLVVGALWPVWWPLS